MGFSSIQQRLEKKVAGIIEQKGHRPPISLASGLWVISRLYGTLMKLRRSFYNRGILKSHRLPCFVISVGNLSIGGTGKTPMTIQLANLLKTMGLKTVVISRGYKGLSEKNGAVVSDGESILCDSRHAGDEPYLVANLIQDVPVVVGRDRVAAGQTALEQFNPDVILMDDGFQHQRLKRDLNLVLVDAHLPFGNTYVLPRGILREPVTALSNADALIITRYDDGAMSNHNKLIQQVFPRPVFCTSHRSKIRGVLPAGNKPQTWPLTRLNSVDAGYLRTKRVFPFSGLAHNNRFWDSLSQFGVRVAGTKGYNDHYAYDHADAIHVVRAAQAAGSDYLVTTDKDYVRLPPNVCFPIDLIVMGITIDFGKDKERWRRFVTELTGSVKG